MNEEERLKAQDALVQMQDKYFMLGFDKAVNKLYFPLDICMELGRRLGGTSVVFKKTEWNRN